MQPYPHKSALLLDLTSSPARQGLALAWLIVAIAVVLVVVVAFLAPDLPRRLLGMPVPPVERGTEIVPEIANPAPVAAKPVATVAKTPKESKTAPVVVKPPLVTRTAAEVVLSFADENQGLDLLAEARAAYKTYKWELAAVTARKITELSVSPETQQYALDVIAGSAALAKIFAALNDRDELVRNYDTHPCLVNLTTKGEVSLAVPTVAVDQLVPVTSDPLGSIEQQKRLGKVTFFMKGHKDFVVSTIDADAIEAVKKVDLAAIMAQVRVEFTSRLSRLSKSADANDALAWYEAARFAYHNRLDDQVTAMMDRALELDPGLVVTVREDRANTYLASMMIHLNNGNRVQAQTFLNVINKRFGDTAVAQQAQAYFKGDQARVLALVKKAKTDQIAANKLKQEAIRARNTALGRATEVAVQTSEEDVSEEAPASDALRGDVSMAEKFLRDGRSLCAMAMKENGLDRNKVFAQAEVPLRKARTTYTGILKKTPADQNAQSKILEVNQLIYLIKKGKVFR